VTAVRNSPNRPPRRTPVPAGTASWLRFAAGRFAAGRVAAGHVAAVRAAAVRAAALRVASPRGVRFCAWCGLAGPAFFTAAWIVSSLRQTGHSATEVQLSGLAAIDARDPQIMMAGFVALGVGSMVFGAALGQQLAAEAVGPRPAAGEGMRGAGGRLAVSCGRLAAGAGPWLVVVAGAAAVAAGLLRRDHMLLVGPGFTGESWHNQGHDLVSGVAYTAMIAAPITLALRLRSEPDWAALCPILFGLALASCVALVLFASRALEPWNGTVQRVAVTLPLAAEALGAGRMLALPLARAGRGSGPRGASSAAGARDQPAQRRAFEHGPRRGGQ